MKSPRRSVAVLRNQEIPPPPELCVDPELSPEEQREAEASAIDLSALIDVIKATGGFEVN